MLIKAEMINNMNSSIASCHERVRDRIQIGSLGQREKLVADYVSWAGLLDAYNMVDIEKRPLMLKNIRVDERRKVGPAASKHIYEFCYSFSKKTETVMEEGHASSAGHKEEGICLI